MEQATTYSKAKFNQFVDEVPGDLQQAKKDQEKKGQFYLSAKNLLTKVLQTKGLDYGVTPVNVELLTRLNLDEDRSAAYAIKLLVTINSWTGSTREFDDTLVMANFLLDSVKSSQYGQDPFVIRNAKARILGKQKDWNSLIQVHQFIYGEHLEDESKRLYATKMIGRSLIELGKSSDALPWLDVARSLSVDSEIGMLVLVCKIKLGQQTQADLEAFLLTISNESKRANLKLDAERLLAQK